MKKNRIISVFLAISLVFTSIFIGMPIETAEAAYTTKEIIENESCSTSGHQMVDSKCIICSSYEMEKGMTKKFSIYSLDWNLSPVYAEAIDPNVTVLEFRNMGISMKGYHYTCTVKANDLGDAKIRLSGKLDYTSTIGLGVLNICVVEHKHENVIKKAVVATCTENGLTEGVYCSKCNEVLVEQKIVPELGHIEVIDKAIPSMCEKDGQTEGKHCSRCNEILVKQEKTPATGHSYGAWIVKEKATCGKTGIKYAECTVCKKIVKEVIDKTNKHIVQRIIVPATIKSNGTIKETCKICKKTVSNVTIAKIGKVKLSATKFTYNGKAKKPVIKVYNVNGKIIPSTKYKVSYQKGRIAIGKYKVSIKFDEKTYSGTLNSYFTIIPKGVSIKKIKSPKDGAIELKWNKASNINGYQIRYSKKSDMSSYSIKTITGKSLTSKTIKGLSKGKKYYVQIRTYKTVAGKKYYSNWSAKKVITTKETIYPGKIIMTYIGYNTRSNTFKVWINNCEKKSITIYSKGAYSLDSDYSYYDRDLKLSENKNSVTIKAGAEKYITFKVKGSTTWPVDSDHTIYFKFKLDGKTYWARVNDWNSKFKMNNKWYYTDRYIFDDVVIRH